MSNDAKKIKQKMNFVYFLVLVSGVCILGRIIYLQFGEGDFWKQKAEDKIYQVRTYRARRGNICAMDSESGELHFMAANVPIYDVYIDLGSTEKKFNPKTQTTEKKRIISSEVFQASIRPLCDSLANLFKGMPKSKTARQYESQLRKAYKKGSRYVEIQKGINSEQLERLKGFPLVGRSATYRRGGKKLLIKSLNNAVVNLTPRSVRIYPYGNLARRTIGISLDNSDTLFDGIDGHYSKFLRGEHGMRMERKINPGIWVPVETENNFLTAKDGNDVITTIDIKLQELAENSLRQCLDSNQASSGCVILMEVKTGYIKAISSLSKLASGGYAEIRNIAVSDLLEPGSTFKTVTAMMLLDKGYADTSDMVPTGIRHFNKASKPIRDVGRMDIGDVTFRRAMERSSNVGISYLVYNHYKNNRRQFAKDLKEYFIYEPLKLDLNVHEPGPTINDTTIYMDDILRLSFGYVTMMTPLQMLAFYNGIANGGKVMKPLFVKEIRQANRVIKTFQPIVLREKMCKNPGTLSKIQDILERVVLYGTGRKLAGTSYGIAGKSGTAEIGYSNRSQQLKHRASFVGYFPTKNPQYSCIVVISEPQKSRTHGGDLAAPVFKDLSDRVIGTLLNSEISVQQQDSVKKLSEWVGHTLEIKLLSQQLHSTLNFSKQTSPWSFSLFDEKGNLKIHPFPLRSGIVPNVKGMTIRDALYLLGNMGLEVSFSGEGKIAEQSLPAKQPFKRGEKIHLTLQ